MSRLNALTSWSGFVWCLRKSKEETSVSFSSQWKTNYLWKGKEKVVSVLD